MDKRIAELKSWGCDIEAAMERMLDDEEFYIECLMTIPNDPNFAALETALAAHETKKAFDCAHTLKGVLANVGLTPLYDKTVEIVEPLRAGHDDHLETKLGELNELRRKLSDILDSRA